MDNMEDIQFLFLSVPLSGTPPSSSLLLLPVICVLLPVLVRVLGPRELLFDAPVSHFSF